jgi:hypothetical protein
MIFENKNKNELLYYENNHNNSQFIIKELTFSFQHELDKQIITLQRQKQHLKKAYFLQFYNRIVLLTNLRKNKININRNKNFWRFEKKLLTKKLIKRNQTKDQKLLFQILLRETQEKTFSYRSSSLRGSILDNTPCFNQNYEAPLKTEVFLNIKILKSDFHKHINQEKLPSL